MRVAPPDFRVAPAVGPARDLGLRIAGALGRTPLPGATPAQAAVGHGRRLAASRAQALGDAFGSAAADVAVRHRLEALDQVAVVLEAAAEQVGQDRAGVAGNRGGARKCAPGSAPKS